MKLHASVEQRLGPAVKLNSAPAAWCSPGLLLEKMWNGAGQGGHLASSQEKAEQSHRTDQRITFCLKKSPLPQVHTQSLMSTALLLSSSPGAQSLMSTALFSFCLFLIL